MFTFKMYGASDDLIELEGVGGAWDMTDDEDDVMGPKGSYTAEFSVSEGKALFMVDGELYIKAEYTRGAIWAFMPYVINEKTIFPADMRINSNGVGSMYLEIFCDKLPRVIRIK